MSIPYGRSGSKNSFPAGQKRPHAGQGDRRAGLADQPGRVQPHPQTGDGRHHQRLHRHPEPPGRPRVCGRPHQPVGGPLQAGRLSGATAEQQGSAAVLPRHRCLYLPSQGELR